MELKLNDIFNLTEEEINNSKIEFNMAYGSQGDSFIDHWLKQNDVDKMNGTCEQCSFWGWYGPSQRNFYPGRWVFSFSRISGDEWLFISAGMVVDVPEKDWAKVEILDRFKPFFGRLIVNCNKGNTFARYTFNLSSYIEKTNVKEILPCLYSGDKFEGYDNVYLPFDKLSKIFKGEFLPSYYEALSKVCGVYCLTDKKTGKLYIGSATGIDGVRQRWGDYFSSKDGGNKKLIELKNKEGEEYFEKYFTFTLIEFFNKSYDPEKVKIREQYWKKCLDTINNGYNSN